VTGAGAAFVGVFVGAVAVFAGADLDGGGGGAFVASFFGGALGSPDGIASGAPPPLPRRASACEIMRGELLVPGDFRPGARSTASTTLPLWSTTRSFMPHVFSQPFLYSRYTWPSYDLCESGSPSFATTWSRDMPGSIVTPCAPADAAAAPIISSAAVSERIL